MGIETLNYEEVGRLLDDVGWQMLRELQIDARISFSELGRRVGLSSPAVAERVRRMEEAGIITGYRACVDPAAVGLPILAIIRLSANDCGWTSERMRTAYEAEFPELLECHRVTGQDSMVMKVAVRSMAHLEELLDRLTTYGTSTTSMVLSSPVEGRVISRAMAEGSTELHPQRR